jgi:hypothetical protein
MFWPCARCIFLFVSAKPVLTGLWPFPAHSRSPRSLSTTGLARHMELAVMCQLLIHGFIQIEDGALAAVSLTLSNQILLARQYQLRVKSVNNYAL